MGHGYFYEGSTNNLKDEELQLDEWLGEDAELHVYAWDGVLHVEGYGYGRSIRGQLEALISPHLTETIQIRVEDPVWYWDSVFEILPQGG